MINSRLNKIVPLIARVVDGQNISAKESEEAFTQIFLHDTAGYHYATFVAAIHAKGETADELLGLCLASKKLGNQIKLNTPINKIIDLSGTGGGSLKTVNVSTTASFIVAAASYAVPKESFYGITSPTGSADLFAAFGIDIAKLTAVKIKKTLEKVRICATYAPFISPKLKARGLLFKKAFIENGLKIRTPFHLVSNLSSSVEMTHRIYGCYSEKYLEILGELLTKLGYKRFLTFCGFPGIPEISNIGKTTVVEQDGKKPRKYILTPKDLGVRKSKLEEIKTGGKEQNIIDFLRILQGKERGPKADLAAINAAAAFYVLGESKSIAGSVPKALKIIKGGKAFKVLERLVKEVGDPKLLKLWLARS
ncbi:MAG: Anthranilate phosphoribosyltransferase [Microgenomates group bacterium GW2011_GWA1_48_10]|uniref:Anthranilate phosphoribosyltransferase n=1 Tax=Candidatus Gottesmanbacteria bacterium RIFCSPHIGHO2_01_FULL_47_48 TaxID=1798381 RepID=A0A1F6A3M4_9BACT|nr:MAG: Anthranilate phosphoribosyltransferase [Microgenomates group bacterium GW2011_GWA1_48_10]OGG19062.1 MAG: anthranilate phosphoribosyltransferase [Candidatus Gottesmanbacteria bacterium RIFCSPHIGHO2_01_FULL_47_48]